MPTWGSAFGDLAGGIFGRLNELRDEQTKRDDDTRKQNLSVLSSLLEQAEPESRGTILQHMADTMKLKGKERGMWDRLTGRGMDNTQVALGDQLRSIMGDVTGPKAAKDMGFKHNFAQALTPRTEDEARNRADTIARNDMSKRIVLRDPYQEKVDLVTARFEQQNAWNQQKLYEQDRMLRERAADAAKAKEAYDVGHQNRLESGRARAAIMKRANELMLSPQGQGKSLDQIMSIAGA